MGFQMRYDTPMSQPLSVNAVPPKTGAVAGATPTPTSTSTPGPVASAVKSAQASASTAATSTATLTSTSTTAATASTLTAPTPSITSPTASVPLTDLPLRQQLRAGLKDMYRSSLSSGRNFAKVGAIFSGTECTIEGLRAKNDIWNGVAGGCITGGVLARNAGPQAAAVGCAGFAVFSAAIDAYMVR